MFDPEVHHRKSIRLHGYDYSKPGSYFITICTHNKLHLFGEIINQSSVLNKLGIIVEETWKNLPNYFNTLELDYYVIMPNHFHGILRIKQTGSDLKSAPTNTDSSAAIKADKKHGLPYFVRALKIFSTRQINSLQDTPANQIWQRNYYEHIIRDRQDYLNIVDYIKNNPKEWEKDQYFE